MQSCPQPTRLNGGLVIKVASEEGGSVLLPLPAASMGFLAVHMLFKQGKV